MSALPLVNAQVTRVAGGGTSEDYDSPPGADTDRWAGSADGYIKEEILTDLNGERRDEVKATVLTVQLDVGDLAQRGDTVTYSYGGEVVTRTLRNIERFRIVGTARLTFWDE